jgi:hypothetical protein
VLGVALNPREERIDHEPAPAALPASRRPRRAATA